MRSDCHVGKYTGLVPMGIRHWETVETMSETPKKPPGGCDAVSGVWYRTTHLFVCLSGALRIPRLDPPMEGWLERTCMTQEFWGSQNTHWIEGVFGYLGCVFVYFYRGTSPLNIIKPPFGTYFFQPP